MNRDTLIYSPHNAVLLSRHYVKAAGSNLESPAVRVRVLIGWTPDDPSNPPDTVDETLYAYLEPTALAHATHHDIQYPTESEGIGALYDADTWYLISVVGVEHMETDGTWHHTPVNSWGDWEYALACPYFYENSANWGKQIDSKIKYTGPMKGTLIKWHAIFDCYDFINAIAYPDPLEITDTPYYAEYIELAEDRYLEMHVTPEYDTGGTFADGHYWGLCAGWAFRRGKQPSDFPWYPL